MKFSFQELSQKIIRCTRCPRLVYFREHAPVRKAFEGQTYWRRPLPGHGDPEAWLLILGLAPAAQGGNRTGRVLTGDESARFLMKGLYEAGLCNQPISEALDDGLKLFGCYITAAVKCVPPDNKPLRQEFINCSEYFENEFFLLKNLTAVLALGKMAFDSYQNFLIKNGVVEHYTPFAHSKQIDFPGWPTLYGCYHPSPQNTYTKKLTPEMLKDLLVTIKKISGKK